MKKAILYWILVTMSTNAISQNVGVGTTAPSEKLDVNGNINLSGALKVNGSAGSSGDALLSTVSGVEWAKMIYILKPANFTTITVPQNNFVKIDGVLALNADYSGLNSQKLNINGGVINGNGTAVFSIGLNSTVSGTTFNNVDINAGGITFVNCNFSGNVPRIGGNCRYVNCYFGGLTLGANNLLGSVIASSMQNCTIPKASEFSNTEIINCFIGNGVINQNSVSLVSECTILGSYFYAFQSDLTFTKNICQNTKLLIGNSNQSPNYMTISGNLFKGVYTGESEVIQINPSSNYFKFYIISDNNFSLQSSTPRAIDVSSNDGNPFANSRINMQNNTFWNSITPLNYSSNLRINYIYNTIFQTGAHPASSGNLVVNYSVTLF
jgi:hypothetical protein